MHPSPLLGRWCARPVRKARRGLRSATFVALCGWAALLSSYSRAATVVTITRHGGGGPGLHGVNGRPPGYLGITCRDVPDDAVAPAPAKAPHGVMVMMVDHDGPAGKAGLRPHDIIVSLNGQAIASVEALHRMLHEAGAGVQIALSVLRSGQPLSLTAQLATRDEVARAAMARLAASDPPTAPSNEVVESEVVDPHPADPAPQPVPPPPSAPVRQGFISSMLHSGSSIGVVLEVMEPQLASYFGAPQGLGLLVHSVIPNSLAAQAGLRAGDVVLRADLLPLHTQADWSKHLRAAKGSPVTLTILRERHELSLSLQTDLKHHSLLEWPVLF